MDYEYAPDKPKRGRKLSGFNSDANTRVTAETSQRINEYAKAKGTTRYLVIRDILETWKP